LYALACCFLFSAKVFAGGEGTNNAADTVSPKTIVKLGPAKMYERKSLINKMSDSQLVNLIDYLFELDSIPYDLVSEITKVVKNRQPVVENTKYYSDSFPSANYYTVWDTKHIFPIDDLLPKHDTSFILDLSQGITGKYFHPFSGLVTSEFGWRDSANHNGIDIDLNRGDPVVAAFDGKVRIAKREGGFGNVVIIRHYNGLETVYAHLWKIKVKPGDIVKAGQLIGLGGSTGHSTGSHLHFEIRLKGLPINPRFLISFKSEELLGSTVELKKTKWGLSAFPITATMYTVQKGDKLSLIAKQYNTTTKKLKELNASQSKYLYLRVGQQIRVL
jgi:murein DD-endopeptidase MepM/ murein hydrolase activator NlpD